VASFQILTKSAPGTVPPAALETSRGRLLGHNARPSVPRQPRCVASPIASVSPIYHSHRPLVPPLALSSRGSSPPLLCCFAPVLHFDLCPLRWVHPTLPLRSLAPPLPCSRFALCTLTFALGPPDPAPPLPRSSATLLPFCTLHFDLCPLRSVHPSPPAPPPPSSSAVLLPFCTLHFDLCPVRSVHPSPPAPLPPRSSAPLCSLAPPLPCSPAGVACRYLIL
jgi:hypothetical protein